MLNHRTPILTEAHKLGIAMREVTPATTRPKDERMLGQVPNGLMAMEIIAKPSRVHKVTLRAANTPTLPEFSQAGITAIGILAHITLRGGGDLPVLLHA